MIHLTEKSFILHLSKGHAQRCPQLVPTHRARLGWRCATLQWPRVEPQVSQVCPGWVVPKQLIKFLVGLNVGWTQILSYDSYDSYLYKLSYCMKMSEHIMKPYESNRNIMKSISSLKKAKWQSWSHESWWWWRARMTSPQPGKSISSNPQVERCWKGRLRLKGI